MIEKIQVLLLDGRRARLGDMFSKHNLRGFMKEEEVRKMGVGRVCAPISLFWVFLF